MHAMLLLRFWPQDVWAKVFEILYDGGISIDDVLSRIVAVVGPMTCEAFSIKEKAKCGGFSM